MIIFGLIFTTFALSINFGGSWGSIENWLKPKTNPPSGILACHSVCGHRFESRHLSLAKICSILILGSFTVGLHDEGIPGYEGTRRHEEGYWPIRLDRQATDRPNETTFRRSEMSSCFCLVSFETFQDTSLLYWSQFFDEYGNF